MKIITPKIYLYLSLAVTIFYTLFIGAFFLKSPGKIGFLVIPSEFTQVFGLAIFEVTALMVFTLFPLFILGSYLSKYREQQRIMLYGVIPNAILSFLLIIVFFLIFVGKVIPDNSFSSPVPLTSEKFLND